MLKIGNLLQNLPADLSEEAFSPLAAGPSTKIERIVSLGHLTPPGQWFDQDWAEWVILLQGEARLEFEDEAEPVRLKPMDYLLIPAHKRHRVAWTAPERKTVWLAVHFIEA